MEIDLAVQSTRLRAQLSGTLATLPLRPDPHRRVAMGVPAEKSVLVTLLFRPTADTLLGDYVGVPVRSPDPANIGALARRPPARNPGITAPAAGAATHSTAAAAARDERPVRLGHALAPLDRVAHGARHRQA